MSLQTWQETLISASVDSTAITNTVTQASCIPAAAKLTLPANYFQVGKMLKITAQGRVSCVVTTPGTLAFQVLFQSIAVFNPTPSTMAMNIVAKTDVAWWLEIILTCRTIGSGSVATLMGQSQWTSEAVVGSPLPSAGGVGSLFIPASAPAVGTGFDSTASGVLDLQAKFSVATATTSIQTHQYKVESLN